MTATVRVLAGGGAALPNQPVSISAQGLSGAPAQTKTDDNGVARLTVTPTGGPVKLGATAGGLPSTTPRVFVPTAGASAKNGQRLILPSAQTVAPGDRSSIEGRPGPDERGTDGAARRPEVAGQGHDLNAGTG